MITFTEDVNLVYTCHVLINGQVIELKEFRVDIKPPTSTINVRCDWITPLPKKINWLTEGF